MRTIIEGLMLVALTASTGAFAGDNALVSPRCDPAHHNATVTEIFQPGALRISERGSVVLNLRIDETGRVIRASIKQTSGSDRLDEAAVKAAQRSWRFLPGTLDGKATMMDVRATLKFAPETPSQDSCVKLDQVFVPIKPTSIAATQAG